jgi:hybrid polyketide synthase / nonribosomal peptide synthetase ACE1
MIFKALDIEKDIIEQGYKENSYDLVIGSLVLHATTDLQKTLENTRRLLKPGGYLIILEITNNDVVRVGFSMSGLPGWWLGQNDGRKLSPCVSSAEWESLLLKSGFSAIDSLTPDHDMLPRPMSVIVSQAIDERISILREPLQHPEARIGIDQWDLVIIGGETRSTITLIDKILPQLEPWDIPVTCIQSLDDIESSSISPTSVVLSLTELDKPIFKDLSDETMKGLKTLFESQKTVLWVTQGCRADEPFMSMTVGFGRSLILEMPDLRLQFLDLDVLEEPNPQLLAEALLRLHLSGVWEKEGNFDDVLWMTEQEIVYEKGRAMIPRLFFTQELNDRFNASKRTITENKNIQSSALSLQPSASGYSLVEDPSLSSVSDQTGVLAAKSDIMMKVSHSLLVPIAASGPNQIYGVLSTDRGTGQTVLGFSTTNGPCVAVPPERRVQYSLTKEKEVQLLSLLDLELRVQSVLSSCSHKSTVLLYEPPSELATRLSKRASEKGLIVSFITSKSELLHDSWITVHPFSPSRTIRASLPLGVSTFIDCSNTSKSGRLGSTIASCLPETCWRTTITELLAQTQSANIADRDLTQHLRGAASRALEQIRQKSDLVSPVAIRPEEISQQNILNTTEPTVVDWSAASTVPMKMSTVDTQIHFAKNKTYVLFGLTSDLAQSICDWMVSHGARNIVLTSRNPKIDSRWINQLKAAGVRLEVFSKLVMIVCNVPIMMLTSTVILRTKSLSQRLSQRYAAPFHPLLVLRMVPWSSKTLHSLKCRLKRCRRS